MPHVSKLQRGPHTRQMDVAYGSQKKANNTCLLFQPLRKDCQCADPLDLSSVKATDIRYEEIHTVLL